MQNFKALGQPFWEKSNQIREKGERENAVNRGSYFLPATPKGGKLPSLRAIKDERVGNVNLSIVVGILIAGGSSDGASTSTEVFLPGSGQTCALADLPDSRYFHTLDTVSNTGVLCGGGDTAYTKTSCLQFNLTTGLL